MHDIDLILNEIVPERIGSCEFDDLKFTMGMLDVYFAVNGKKSLLELSDQLSMDIAELIICIKIMTRMKIMRVRSVDKSGVSKNTISGHHFLPNFWTWKNRPKCPL